MMELLKLNFFGILLMMMSCTESQPTKPKLVKVETQEVEPVTFTEDLKNTKINYTYFKNTQTHDYSNNWDFDGDGKKDSLRFVNERGAHQQYFLSIKLSSLSTPFIYEWIYNDMPVLSSFKFFPKASENEREMHWFIVEDFNKDGIKDIFVNVNASGYGLPEKFKEFGLDDHEIVLTYNRTQEKFVFHNWREI